MSTPRKRLGVRAASLVAIPAVIAALGGGAAVAQEENNDATEATSDDKCAAVHLVLVNGTFDTSAGESSTTDHGFGAQIAGKAMRKANETPPDDPSAGIALENAPDQLTSEPRAQVDEESPAQDVWGTSPAANGQEADHADDLWGDTPETSEQDTASSGGLWGEVPKESTTASETESESEEELSIDDLWGDAPEPSEDWSVDEGEELTHDGVKMARTYVTYPAAAGGAFIPGLQMSESIPYKESMYEGAKNTAKVLSQISSDCPETKVFLAGHSQGAQVVSAVAREIGNGVADFPADKIAGVALFSDPTRDEAVPVMQGTSNTPAPVPGTDGGNVKQVGDFFSPEQDNLDGAGMGVNHGGKDFGALSDRVASWCADGDLVCDLPISGELSQLVIGTAERLELDDPEASLQAVKDTLGPAVQLGGVDQVDDGEINFGEGGFKAQAEPAAEENTLLSQISASGQAETVKPGALIDGLGESVVSTVSTLGGMALNTGIAVAKEAVTIENLAQVGLAGVQSPQLGMAVAASKLIGAANDVVTPEFVSARAEEVMNEVDVMGISGKGLTDVAVQAAGHGAAHNSYGTRPMTADGRTAIDATVDWVVASARDSAGDGVVPLEVTEVVPVADYNPDIALQALEEIKQWKQAL